MASPVAVAVTVAEPGGVVQSLPSVYLMELDFSTSAAVPSASPRLGRPAELSQMLRVGVTSAARARTPGWTNLSAALAFSPGGEHFPWLMV